MATGIFVNRLLATVVADVPADIRYGETHTLTSTPSKFALENGETVSDHIVVNPAELEINFGWNNLDVVAGLSYGIKAFTLFTVLRRALESRKRFVVVTRHHLYTNMALVSLIADHDPPQIGALNCRAKFVNIPTPDITIASVPKDQLATDGTQLTASTATESGTLILEEVAQNSNLLDLSETFGALGA